MFRYADLGAFCTDLRFRYLVGTARPKNEHMAKAPAPVSRACLPVS